MSEAVESRIRQAEPGSDLAVAWHGSLAPMTEGLERLLYRIVPTDPPSLRDFMSYEQLGVRPRRPLSPTDRDRWRGVSDYGSFAAAVAAMRAAPRLGRYIATVRYQWTQPSAWNRRDAIMITSQPGLTRPRYLGGWNLSSPSKEYTDSMHYELWDLLSRNMMADFETEVEALTAVRDLLALNTPEMTDELILVWRDADRGGTIAEGAELAARARAVTPGRAPSSA